VKHSSPIDRAGLFWTSGAFLSVALLVSAPARAQQPADSPSNPSSQDAPRKKSDAQQTVKLRIEVTGDTGKPVSNASVYVRYTIPAGLLHKERLAELDLKTNGDGSVRVPDVPQGKILIQIIAPGWKTYGEWYEIVDKTEESIEIKLDRPHRWY
jgi:hypothetical protein